MTMDRRTAVWSFFLGLVLFTHVHAAKQTSIKTSYYGFKFEISSDLTTHVSKHTAPWRKMLTPNDHPASLFPEHAYFQIHGPYLEVFNAAQQSGHFSFPPEIHFYPIEGFKEVLQPEPKYVARMEKDIARFNELLDGKASELKYVQDTLFMAYPMGNVVQTFMAKIEPLKFKSGKGVAFMTQLQLEPTPFYPDALLFVFQGLSTDRKYIVTATFPIRPRRDILKDMSQIFSDDDVKNQETFIKYLAEIKDRIDHMSFQDFEPSIEKLHDWIRSIQID